MSIGYLANTFDLLNVRDLDLIEQARVLCSRLVVGVFTDDFARHVSGRRPVVPFGERLALVSHVRGVDEVVTHGFPSAAAAPGDVIFSVAGDPEPEGVTTVCLTPRRSSLSPDLRRALESSVEEDVA